MRERLIRAGVELLAEQGAAAVSLREIARRAGVSHGAPRRYFPTHLELLSAIAREGFSDLTARVTATLDPQATPHQQLTAMSRIYLDFAAARPGMFELMFRHDLLRSDRLGLRDSALPLFTVLVERMNSPAAAGAFWANLHGIAQLWQWQSLPLALGSDDREPLLRAALDAHLGDR